MKRKITRLEETLISNGYRLTQKTYQGKNSEKTLGYSYVLYSSEYDYIIVLDYKREKVIDFGILNIYSDFVNNDTLIKINQRFMRLNKFVATLLADQPTAQVLKDYDIYIESDVDHHLKKRYGTTFEELDIENQEIESGEK